MRPLIAVVLVVTGWLPAQETDELVEKEGGLTPVTVCEVFENPAAFDKKLIFVAGKTAATGEGLWLVEDDCPPKTYKSAEKHPKDIWMKGVHDPTVGAPPRMPTVDPKALDKKLADVRRTNVLRTHPIMSGKMVTEQLVLVFGRIDVFPESKEGGFGHLNGSRIQIVHRWDGVTYFSPAYGQQP